tara:strand:- start:141 stop:755 length:615 start_codon:yes stop_codon:yes gene_type:complete
MIGIINTGFGNINSIYNILYENNIRTKIINNQVDFSDVNKLILPGIGKFDSLINKLNEMNIFDELINEVLIKKKYILGICIGMHVFYESSAEGSKNGFAWIEGKIEKLDNDNVRLPHMGWNKVFNTQESKLFKDINEGSSFYFLHSYGNKVDSNKNYNHSSFCKYGIEFISSIEKNNIFGVQFHPEKSHRNGTQLILNFSNMND